MQTIIFASNNQHKVNEIKIIIGDQFQILSLKEAGINVDIPEPFDTLEQNAKEKSRVIHSLTGENCFSEDTGLEVDALNGEPGVKSARYAGEQKDDSANIKKLVRSLENKENRSARFRTVISLILFGQSHVFEGICEGQITNQPVGDNGFGYDSVFIPEGATKTFAQMNMEEKNLYSHRRKASEQMFTFLSHVGKNDL